MNNAVAQNGPEFAQGAFGLFAPNLLDFGFELGDVSVHGLRDLLEDQRAADHGALSDEVHGVVQHGLDHLDGFGVRLPGARDAERHRHAVPDVGVVALSQQVENFGQIGVVVDEHEAQRHDGCPLNVVAHIRRDDVKKLLDRLGLTSPAIGHADHEGCPVPQNGVLLVKHLLDG